MTLRVGFIGIGLMGSGMAKNLRKAGFAVTFVAQDNERDRENAAMLEGEGAVQVEGYKALADAADVIMLSVPDSSVVEPLIRTDEGIGPHLRAGQIMVDLSTSYPPSTRQLAKELEARGVMLLDAPLTGSRKNAADGTLNVMCGGPSEAFDRVRPLFDAIAANVFHVGPVGSGHAIKLINNYLGMVTFAGMCEVFPFAEKFGVDMESLCDVVGVSGGDSKIFRMLAPKMMRRDYAMAFQQKFVHKDLRYTVDLMREAGCPTPLAETILSLHDRALADGYGERDISAFAEFFEKLGDSDAD